MSTITGSCFCGSVRYRIDDAPSNSTVCHCAGCRRASAAPAVAWVTMPVEAFQLVQGTLSSVRGRESEGDSCDSCGGERGFCAQCGTQITFVGDDRKHEIDITTGSLDDPNAFPPTEDVFAHKKVAWMKTLA